MPDVTATALVAFRIDAPAHTRSVELLGSWDNFTHSYRMERDQKRSRRHWYGVFTFKDIICDGENPTVSGKREGGLKMGGTYWYHYILDGNYEFHDESKPSTTACPLLPGECLNIIEVPYEEPWDLTLDMSFPRPPALSPPFTMDPHARFTTPRPNKFEALARKPLPPPSPVLVSPVTASHEDSWRESISSISTDSTRPSISSFSHRLYASSSGGRTLAERPLSAAVDGRPSSAGYQRIASLDTWRVRASRLYRSRRASVTVVALSTDKERPACLRSDSGIAGPELGARREKSLRAVLVSLVEEPERPDGDGMEDGNTGYDADDALSDSGATLGCWRHRACFLQAKEESGGYPRKEASRAVETWVEDTRISMDEDVLFGNDHLGSFDQSPTDSEFSQFLEEKLLLDTDGHWSPPRLSDYREHAGTDEEGLGLSEEVGQRPSAIAIVETVAEPTASPGISSTEQSVVPPPVLDLETSITEGDSNFANPSEYPRLDATVDEEAEPPYAEEKDFDHFMEAFILPPLNARISDGDNTFIGDSMQPLRSAASNTTSDVPQLDHSSVLSPTSSSPTTAASTWTDKFRSYSEDSYASSDSQPNEWDRSQLDSPSPAGSPALLPTIPHFRTNSWFGVGGFQGYSLPEEHYSSQATLTKITTQATIVRSEWPSLCAKRHSVAPSGDDGVEAIVGEFAYLGEAVI